MTHEPQDQYDSLQDLKNSIVSALISLDAKDLKKNSLVLYKIAILILEGIKPK